MANGHAVNHRSKPKKSDVLRLRRDSLRDTICIAAVGDIMLGSSYPD